MTSTRHTIAFAALLISGLLCEIWITLYKAFNFDFSDVPEILSVIHYIITAVMAISLIGLIWYGLISDND